MKKVINLEFDQGSYGCQRTSFTRDSDFDLERWRALHSDFLKEIGVSRITFCEVGDDFKLPWEKS
jgi:hypothetical protein